MTVQPRSTGANSTLSRVESLAPPRNFKMTPKGIVLAVMAAKNPSSLRRGDSRTENESRISFTTMPTDEDQVAQIPGFYSLWRIWQNCGFSVPTQAGEGMLRQALVRLYEMVGKLGDTPEETS